MGSPPPAAFPAALLQLAVRSRSVGVCRFWGVSDKVRESVVKEFRVPVDEVRLPRGKFEEEFKKFRGQSSGCGRRVRGRGTGVLASEARSAGSGRLPLPTTKRHRGW